MKMTESMLADLRYCAEDMARNAQKILGMLESHKAINGDKEEDAKESKVTGGDKLTSLFMKETKGNKKKK